MSKAAIDKNSNYQNDPIYGLYTSNEKLIEKCEEKKAQFNVMEEYWKNEQKTFAENFRNLKKQLGVRFRWQLNGDNLLAWNNAVSDIYNAKSNLTSVRNKYLSTNSFELSLQLDNGKYANMMSVAEHTKQSFGLS